jgi:hypothetical protein
MHASHNKRQRALGAPAWIALTAIVSAGMVGFTYFLIAGFFLNRGDVLRLEAPGEGEAALVAGTTYAVYHEFRLADDSVGQVKPAGADRVRVQVQPAGGGPPLAVEPYAGVETYALRRVFAESLARFSAPETGAYRVVALFASEDPPDPVVLVLRPSARATAQTALVRGGATLALSLALVLLVVRLGLREAQ